MRYPESGLVSILLRLNPYVYEINNREVLIARNYSFSMNN